MIKRLFKRKKRDQIDISIDGKKYTFKGITLEKWYTMQDLSVDWEKKHSTLQTRKWTYRV